MNLTVAGCGPAGLIAAISAAQGCPGLDVLVLEREAEPLRWMNDPRNPPALTRADDDADAFAAACPNGGEFMRGACMAFPPSQMALWLREAGIRCQTMPDASLRPLPGLAAQRLSICLLEAAKMAGVRIVTGNALVEMSASTEGFRLWTKNGPSLDADYVLLATGGRSGQLGWALATQFGHMPRKWVPSPVLLCTNDHRAKVSAPLEVPGARAWLPELDAEAGGGVTLHPNGIGGRAVLELTARHSAALAELGHTTMLEINWAAHLTQGQPTRILREIQQSHARKTVVEDPVMDLPVKLWERLLADMKLPPDSRWSALSPAKLQALAGQIVSTRIKTDGRAMNKAEWVASGGVPLEELAQDSLQSLRQRGLYMAGEMLDIDALPGGWNLHCAWATGWMAGNAVADAARARIG